MVLHSTLKSIKVISIWVQVILSKLYASLFNVEESMWSYSLQTYHSNACLSSSFCSFAFFWSCAIFWTDEETSAEYWNYHLIFTNLIIFFFFLVLYSSPFIYLKWKISVRLKIQKDVLSGRLNNEGQLYFSLNIYIISCKSDKHNKIEKYFRHYFLFVLFYFNTALLFQMTKSQFSYINSFKRNYKPLNFCMLLSIQFFNNDFKRKCLNKN